jgi:hypothetical protein
LTLATHFLSIFLSRFGDWLGCSLGQDSVYVVICRVWRWFYVTMPSACCATSCIQIPGLGIAFPFKKYFAEFTKYVCMRRELAFVWGATHIYRVLRKLWKAGAAHWQRKNCHHSKN